MYNPLNFSWVIDGKLAGHKAIFTSDDISFLKKQGVKALIRMAEGETAKKLHQELLSQGFVDLHSPVPDFTAPPKNQITAMIDFINGSIEKGWPVSVSCGAGYGRAGTILACYLVTRGLSALEAIEIIRDKRPGSIETPEQEQAIWEYFKNLKK